MKLTDEQRAIVRHTGGPALVFAVAGSGKTTCMVHRIKHLIDRETVASRYILATSFNNSAVADIETQLARLGVPTTGAQRVDCRTLHSLGYRLIRSAVQRRYLPREWLRKIDVTAADEQLVSQTLVKMAMEDGVDTSELAIDREDLKNQIAVWKSNLLYPDLSAARLPEEALPFARQASHQNEQYLRAYRVYEELRRKKKIITFDDMLMTGWEVLIRYPDILKAVQGSYRMVMVDEFQDVNFAQYQLLDHLTRPHRNYMAIGDDDQCIYEWRGADPRFILSFEDIYGARVYTISDNFRSTAQQIILANTIIAHNQQRYPKHLSLTRGFDGQTHLHELENDWAIAKHIVAEIKQRIKKGARPEDLVILVRLFSQTAFLEIALMDEQFPYEIAGNQPFYKRSEVIPLFQYLSFALAERRVRRKGFPQDEQQSKKYLQTFQNIINKPRRYISRDLVAFVVQEAPRRKTSVVDLLLEQRSGLKKPVQKHLDRFEQMLKRLIDRVGRSAHSTLGWLAEEIDYDDYLLSISGNHELGLSRIQNVEALIEFAKTRRLRCEDFLEHLRQISLHPIPNPHQLSPLKIMTMFRAKGLEWDTVFVPGCYEGLAPCIVEEDLPEDSQKRKTEGERRLFYVAVTRAKRTLHLYYRKDKPISPFLKESSAAQLLKDVEKLKKILYNQRPVFRRKELRWLCRGLARFHLERYFSRWLDPSKPLRTHVKLLLKGLEDKVEQARAAEQQYQTAQAEYRQQIQQYEAEQKSREARLRETPLLIHKFKSAFYPANPGQKISFEWFEEKDIVVLSERGMVGMVDFAAMPDFDRYMVNWEHSRAVITRVISPIQVEARFKTLHHHLPDDLPDLTPPVEVPEKLREYLHRDFQKGLKILKKLLR